MGLEFLSSFSKMCVHSVGNRTAPASGHAVVLSIFSLLLFVVANFHYPVIVGVISTQGFSS